MAQEIKDSNRKRIVQAATETTGDVLPRGNPLHDQAGQFSAGERPADSQADRARASGISVRTQAKLDWLAQQRPDLKAQVEGGELSVDRAYRLARGLPEMSLLDRVKKLWAQANEAEKMAIATWVMTAYRNTFGGEQ